MPDPTEEVSSEENNDAEETLESKAKGPVPEPQKDAVAIPSADTDERLETLAKERDALREEVAQVRKSLEEIQEKHEVELSSIREQLAETQGEKEQAESQYRSLLGKVNTIKFQLGERLKADAVSIFESLLRHRANTGAGRSFASTKSNRRTRGAVRKLA